MKKKTLLPKLARLRRLPKRRQTSFTVRIYDMLAYDERWNASFAASQGLLAQMAEAAQREYEAGKTRPLSFGML